MSDQINQINQIEACAVELLRDGQGLSFTRLVEQLAAALPHVREATLRNAVHLLPRRAVGIIKPRRGIYALAPEQGETAAPGESADGGIGARPGRLGRPQRETDEQSESASHIGAYRIGAYTRVEQRYYPAFAAFVGRVENCARCIPLGGHRLGAGTPDILGRCAPAPRCVVPFADIIVAGELKCDARRVEQGLGQAFGFRRFAHKSYLALPGGEVEPVERAAELCQQAGVGLCTFDPRRPDDPGFELRLRAVAAQPDMTVLNAKLDLLRDELW